MHAYIIIGHTLPLRMHAIREHLRTLSVSSFDEITPITETPSIGVADIRTFIHALSLRPHQGTHTAGIIAEAEKLTVEAQQALLKTIEEPPPAAYIFLGAANTSQLLPTIVSRCTVIRGTSEKSSDTEPDTEQLRETIRSMLSQSIGAMIRNLQTIGKTKEDHARWMDQAIRLLESDLTSTSIPEQTILLRQLLNAKQHVGNNVSPIFLIEHAFLHTRLTMNRTHA